MSNDPYGRRGPPNDELARLAQQGEAMLRAAQQGQHASANEAADRNLRTALGAVHGAPWKRVILVALVLSVVVMVGGGALAATLGQGEVFGLSIPLFANLGMFAFFGLIMLYVFVPPLSSRAAVEAERAWVASLPFALDGYFEALSSTPRGMSHLRVELWWAGQGVDPRTLQGLIALFDTQSRLAEPGGAHTAFSTGNISGLTGIRVNRVPVYRNHRLGTAVHRLVEVVLLPMHRGAPLARVRVQRV